MDSSECDFDLLNVTVSELEVVSVIVLPPST